MAVDVEPTVFWDGASDDFSARLSRWCESVGFRPGDERGQHGHVLPRSPSTNGSSGAKVVEHYLAPLDLAPQSVTFTDIYPVFVVKTGKRGAKSRGQGGAIRDEYDPVAEDMGMRRASIPERPSPAHLPGLAAREYGTRLVSDIADSAAELVITLGAEVWATFLLMDQMQARPPTETFAELYGQQYGRTGELRVFGKKMTWLPLVHPGLLGAVVDSDAIVPGRPRTVRGWNSIHARWKSRLGV